MTSALRLVFPLLKPEGPPNLPVGIGIGRWLERRRLMQEWRARDELRRELLHELLRLEARELSHYSADRGAGIRLYAETRTRAILGNAIDRAYTRLPPAPYAVDLARLLLEDDRLVRELSGGPSARPETGSSRGLRDQGPEGPPERPAPMEEALEIERRRERHEMEERRRRRERNE